MIIHCPTLVTPNPVHYDANRKKVCFPLFLIGYMKYCSVSFHFYK